MNLPVSGGSSPWPRRIVSVLVVLLIAGIAAATFVVSYAGVRDLAISAGVPWRLARLYPAILDGVLVVACTAAFVLRDDSSVLRRLWAWLATAILVGVIGAADAIHAMNVNLPHRPAEGTVAALPWAVVMLGFSLWLTMLRFARANSAAATASPGAAPPATAPVPDASAPSAVAGGPAGAATAPQAGAEPEAGTEPQAGAEPEATVAVATAEPASTPSGDPATADGGSGHGAARGAIAAIGRTRIGPAPAPLEDAGLDLALGIVHDTLDDGDDPDEDLPGTSEDADDSEQPGGDVAASTDDTTVGEKDADHPDLSEEPGAVKDQTAKDGTDTDGAGEQTDEPAPTQHPKLYRVRSTPVPPAE